MKINFKRGNRLYQVDFLKKTIDKKETTFLRKWEGNYVGGGDEFSDWWPDINVMESKETLLPSDTIRRRM